VTKQITGPSGHQWLIINRQNSASDQVPGNKFQVRDECLPAESMEH